MFFIINNCRYLFITLFRAMEKLTVAKDTISIIYYLNLKKNTHAIIEVDSYLNRNEDSVENDYRFLKIPRELKLFRHKKLITGLD